MNLDKIEVNKLKVTQSNALIRSAYTMTLQEKRLMLLILSLVRQQDTEFKTYELSAKQVYNYMGINPKNGHRILKDVTEKLLSRVISIEQDNGSWTKFQWVSRSSYYPKGVKGNKEAILEIRIHEDMAPLLLELEERFRSISFDQLIGLSSFHTIRIFEMLYHFSHGFQIKQVKFDLSEFRQILDLGDKYPNFKELRRRVLEPARKECLEKTILGFSYDKILEGRTVVALNFTVWRNKQEKTQLSLAETAEDIRRANVTKQLKAIGYKRDPSVTIEEYGLSEVEETLALLKERQKANKNIKNTAGYFAKLLKENSAQPNPKDKDEQTKNKKQETQANDLLAAYQNAKRTYAASIWNTLDKQTQTKIHQKMESALKPFELDSIRKQNWQGLLYEIQRNESLLEENLLRYEPNLENLASFAKTYAPLKPLSNQEQNTIVQLALAA